MQVRTIEADNMKRIILIVMAILVLLSVLLDPYTFRRTAGDYVEWAPLWQMVLGIGDVLLLLVVIVRLGRTQVSRAKRLLLIETLFNLGVAIVLVGRDGQLRFVYGLGAEEYLLVYLAAVALRVSLVMALTDSSISMTETVEARGST
jgi:hypothetical protein